MKEETMNEDLKTWTQTVITLFDMLDGNDLVLRPAIAPFDGVEPGTVVTIVHRNTTDARERFEEHFSSCDFETFSGLARDFLRRANTHSVVNGATHMCVWNKAGSPENRLAA